MDPKTPEKLEMDTLVNETNQSVDASSDNDNEVVVHSTRVIAVPGKKNSWIHPR